MAVVVIWVLEISKRLVGVVGLCILAYFTYAAVWEKSAWRLPVDLHTALLLFIAWYVWLTYRKLTLVSTSTEQSEQASFLVLRYLDIWVDDAQDYSLIGGLVDSLLCVLGLPPFYAAPHRTRVVRGGSPVTLVDDLQHFADQLHRG